MKNNAGPAGEDVVSQATKQAFIAQTPETFTYDLDGNLTADARWIYTWDAENRLTSMTTQPSASTAGLPKQKLEYTYDAMDRRIQKKVFSWNTTLATWNLDRDLRFLYDGWNLQAELLVLGTSNLSLQQSYIWGQDLSGSLQGAGGVGGLLLTTKSGSAYATGYDGNGNIQTLTNLADGTTSADFEYDPFGNTIKATGSAANVCPFGFSTKYTDIETGLLYYGYRYYAPSPGRWLSRDPAEEAGGIPVYTFADNNSINSLDRLGLAVWKAAIGPAKEVGALTKSGNPLRLGETGVAKEVEISCSPADSVDAATGSVIKGGPLEISFEIKGEYFSEAAIRSGRETLFKGGGGWLCAKKVSSEARLDEEEHLEDFRHWYNNVAVPLVAAAEKFAKCGCNGATKDTLLAALRNSLRDTDHFTGDFWDTPDSAFHTVNPDGSSKVQPAGGGGGLTQHRNRIAKLYDKYKNLVVNGLR